MKYQEKCHFSACSLSRPFSAGFTLFETMIVFLVLGIITILGWPALNASLEHHRLAGAADEIVTALEFAQLRALSGRDTRVVIGAPQDRIAVRQYQTAADLFGGGDELADSAVENETFELMGHPMNKGADYEIKFTDEDRFQGVDITASDFNVEAPVRFGALGTPSKGGTVTLACGGRQMVVTLDALTGKVTVSE